MNPRFNAVDSPNSVIILAQSAIAVTSPADATEDVFAWLAIQGGLMGIAGALRLTTLWSMTNSANNKTLRARFGGLAGADFFGNVIANQATLHHQLFIRNRGAANSQVGPPPSQGSYAVGTAAVIVSAVNTALDTSLVITGQKATAGETLTLESYLLELIPSPF